MNCRACRHWSPAKGPSGVCVLRGAVTRATDGCGLYEAEGEEQARKPEAPQRVKRKTRPAAARRTR